MEPFVGEIKLFASNFAPQGWALCNGETVLISEYVELFSVIGNTYGGNGVQNFNLPNLTGVANSGEPAATVNYIISTTGFFPTRN